MGRAGIFVLRNTTTGEQYVGQSKDIDNQRKKQDSLMRNGRHYNSYIQQDYNRGHRFSFSVLEYCTQSQLNQRKNYWIRQLNTFNHGYNQTGRNRNRTMRTSRPSYTSYSSTSNQISSNIKKEIKSNPPQGKTDGEKKISQDKLQSALDKYNRRFNRLARWLKFRYLILFLIIIWIFPPIVANLSLIILAIVWIGIFLAKNEYNSQVDDLNQYGFDYKKIDHTTIKAIKLLSGEDLETDFSKPRENINSNDDADDKKNIVTTKKEFKWKKCPSCNHLLNSVAKKCPYCEHVFEE